MDQEILTLKQACQYLQVSEMTLRRWLKVGKVPGRKIGRHWRFVKSELKECVSKDGQPN